MKQVISGKLKEQPVVQEKRNRKTGEKVSVLSFTLLAEDDAAPEVEVDGVLQKKRIPLSCMAYGDLAREIGELEKGARVTASTIMVVLCNLLFGPSALTLYLCKCGMM